MRHDRWMHVKGQMEDSTTRKLPEAERRKVEDIVCPHAGARMRESGGTNGGDEREEREHTKEKQRSA